MERSNHEVHRETIIPNKMDKTITVIVETKKIHPSYRKRIRHSKKFKAHDKNNEARMGGKVEIMETCPSSATKGFHLAKIVEKAIQL